MPKLKKKSVAQKLREQRERNAKRRSDPLIKNTIKKANADSMRRIRENPIRREEIKNSTAASKRKAREDPERRDELNKVSAASMQKAREDSERREELRNVSAASMQKAREDCERREELKNVSAASMRKAREDPERREELNKVSAACKRHARSHPERREELNKVSAASMQKAREDSERREDLKKVSAASMQKAREDSERREELTKVSAASMQKAREDPERREELNKVSAACKRHARSHPKRRDELNKVSATSMRKAREDSERREEINKVSSVSKRNAREDPWRREKVIKVSAECMRKSRLDPLIRTPEKIKDSESRRLKRKIPIRRLAEQLIDAEAHRKKRKLKRSDYASLLAEYKEKIRRAPSFICSCCGGLFYEESTVRTSKDLLTKRKCTEDFINTVLHVSQENHRFCHTCKVSVYRQRIPKLCLSNGFDFPSIPEQLQNLSPLEERLVAPRVPFMQIRLLGAERQSQLRENVVNVENDLDICAQVLPRNFDNTSTVQVQFMRRMKYTKPYLYETIRPKKVLEAAMYLMDTELYKSENIILSDEWTRKWHNCNSDYRKKFVCNAEDMSLTNVDQNDNDDNPSFSGNEDSAIANEEAVELENLGADETLIYRANEIHGIRIAPAEGNHPIPLYDDLHAEELSFPTIYCGIGREFQENIKVTYTDIAKSELRRYERRACQPSKLLYSFKKSFNEKVSQALQICMRKKVGNKSVTVGNLKTPGFIENLVRKDEGYAVFKNVRSSPSYWKQKSKKVIAMVRQLGKCTFFVTLSAAETKWAELLVMLMKIVKNTDISEEDALSLPFEEKAELIRSDPVTCMTHFDHRYRALLTLLLKEKFGIFSPYQLKDYFSRMEFQMRGSPHQHMLLWIENAPEYIEDDDDSVQKCIEFIDKFISCERSEDEEMQNIIGYQIHNHSHTCKKKLRGGQICRFGFPKPPMEETTILKPLPKEIESETKKKACELFIKIQDTLDNMGKKFKDEIPFGKFLKSLQTTKEDYILAVRSSIKRSTVFLKRSTNAIFVNQYNRQLLHAWGANIDIQFVLDTYACAKYCVGYILKSDGGVSKLLQAATNDAKAGNATIAGKLKKFANILINGSEISAQEAAAFLLGFHNTDCSRQDIFINTAHPEERIGILKSKEDLDELGDDCSDICAKGIIDRYSQRPKINEMENLCLADFASLYEFVKTRKSKSQGPDEKDEDIAGENSDDSEIGSVASKSKIKMELLDKSGHLRKRRGNAKIVRYRHYGKADDFINYSREQLMLFLPWRNEKTELLDIDPIQKANQCKEEIQTNSQKYFSKRDVDDEALNAVLNEIEDADVDDGNTYEYLDEEEDQFDETFNPSDTQLTGSSKIEHFLPPRQISSDKYKNLMRSLNDKQRRFVLHVLHLLKSTDKPRFYNFLIGGAGVGKSHVITAIIQSYLRFDAAITQEHNLEEACVLVSAPTGKAAFNVFGMTLHGTFRLPPTQYGGRVCDLEDSVINSLRVKLSKTKLYIIDEISMVSVKQLYDIDQRLRQVYCTQEDFGGKAVIIVGHLRQLPPVAGTYAFKAPRHLPLGEIAGNHLWEHFQLFELDEIMRQKGDYEFCKALNNMSEGCTDKQDIALLKTRKITTDNVPPENAIRLFRTNKECQDYNNIVHRSLNTRGVLSRASDHTQGKRTLEARKALLEHAKTLTPQQTDGLPYETRLQVEGVYFVSTNVDVPDGLFNGSTGYLKQIDTKKVDNDEFPTCAWLDFTNSTDGNKGPPTENTISSLIGIRARSQRQKTIKEGNINPNWVPIGRTKRILSKIGRNQSLQIARRQIPLVAANGMTIAKSQGSSLPVVVVNVNRFHNRKLSRELLYVACSRATSLGGLFIDGEFEAPDAPHSDDAVTLEMARLRNNGFLFSLKFLADYGSNFEKLYFHNIESFSLHYLDVLADLPGAMCSNVLGFVEPHLRSTDNFIIHGYTPIHRSNSKQTSESSTNSEGAIVLVKNNVVENVNSATHITDKSADGHCLFVQWQQSNVKVIMVYKSPNYSRFSFVSQLRNILQQLIGEKIIVVGDININLQKPEGRSIINMFERFELQTKLDKKEPSTNGGTQIDCCFSNVTQLDAWFYESYYSYHKPICAIWPKNV